MASSEKQETLVKESWEVLEQNIPEYSLRFFSTILETAPAAKDMFSFLKDSDEIPQNNPKLKVHAVKVFKMTCESAIQLREKGEVVVSNSTMKYLGGERSLTKNIKEALEEKWNEEMGLAWDEAYDHLAAAIKAEKKTEAAAQTS